MASDKELGIINVEEIEKTLANLHQKVRITKSGLNHMPEGKLRFSNNDGTPQPYQIIGTHRRQISRDPELVYRLARKYYLEQTLDALEKDIRLFTDLKKDYASLDPKQLMAHTPKHFDMLDLQRISGEKAILASKDYPRPDFENNYAPLPAPHYLSDISETITPEEWAKMPYCANTIAGLKSKSEKGIYTRSKSEALILDIYDKLGIYYHYDENFLFNNLTLSPDIVGYREYDGAFIYHEHLGLTDAQYQRKYDFKTRIYRESGILLGSNLLYTYDKSDFGINLELIADQIKDLYFK